MEHFKQNIFLLSIILLITSGIQAQSKKNLYTHPEFKTLTKDHKVLAILPFYNSVKTDTSRMKRMSPKEKANIETKEGIAIQGALEAYFQERKAKKAFDLKIQDTNDTNKILADNNINTGNFSEYAASELARILNVDAILTGSFKAEKPVSNGAASFLNSAAGFSGATNWGDCTIKIIDGHTEELLWKYKKSSSKTLGSNMNMVINTLMKKASRKFPYNNM